MDRLTQVMQLTNGATAAWARYSYDAAGRLRIKSYGNNDRVTYTYDIESRLVQLGITNGTFSPITWFTYGWDAAGNILAITNCNTNVTLYAYDAVGQLTNEVRFTIGLAGRTTN
ncbi:MAG: RHS repeat domain-containing protein, partial [Verrucomicrobiales bacterium]|nr:RHS repeat domain-containing protein [Verrucomicrobiales bacterium]